ncbi:RluA family pseudouridine synthase [Fibrobacterales bacterium]|nr:RluA family pseudouridine synthase [Fibrobacterales bacterium]
MRELIISSNEKEQRLDRFLKKYLANASSGNIQKMLRKRVFKINGKREKNGALFLQEGDHLEIFLTEESLVPLLKAEKKHTILAKPILDLIFENDDLLIFNKPTGQLTTPDTSNDTQSLTSQVQQAYQSLCSITFNPSPIQRLDKNTSGLVVFAKNYNSLKNLNYEMRERKIQKFYQCIIEGVPSEKHGSIKGFLTKDTQSNKVTFSKQKSQNQKLEAKAIHTDYKVLKSKNGFSLLEIELHSGRSHQIRVSLAYLGHPIIGDLKYGAQKSTTKNLPNHQALHAYKVVVNEITIEHTSNSIERVWNTLN